MNQSDLIAIAKKSDADIAVCKVIEQKEGYIRFSVDEGLSKPRGHFSTSSENEIIDKIIEEEQIEHTMGNIVASSFQGERLNYPDADVMFTCFVHSYAEHRPLVLSPDMIWLLINQTIAKHINRNADSLRDTIVSHQGKMDLIVESGVDILTEKADWNAILSGMYEQIAENTEGDLAQTMRCDFSTTSDTEFIASIATLMGAVKAYFRYHVVYCICGIPEITLLGTPNDWEKVLLKAELLKKVGLGFWLRWLKPILGEFIRASYGKPNQTFWKSTVMTTRLNEEIEDFRGCIPVDGTLDGWFVALFPFVEGKRQPLRKCEITQRMAGEMIRVGFKYHRLHPLRTETVPMELWAGFVGIEENPITYALTPKIGWFVRKSDESAESLARLRAQDADYGIHLTVREVPSILQNLSHINRLFLRFTNGITLPDWLDNIVDEICVFGTIDAGEEAKLKKRFKSIRINPEDEYMPVDDDDF